MIRFPVASWPSLFLCLLPGLLTAQTLDPGLLLKPPKDAWPTYNGD
jgi:hypothetical protein